MEGEKQGKRFQDFPKNRYVINCKKFNIVVNKEEHLMFIFNTCKNYIQELIKFTKKIE